MSWPYKETVDDLESRYQASKSYIANASSRTGQARTHWNANQDHAALDDLIEAVAFVVLVFKQIVYKWDDPVLSYPLIDVLKLDWEYTNETFPSFDLSFLDIIEAYINADDDHRSGWQLLTDAYQASMYDKPFDLEYHTGWVARFRSWA